MKKLFTFLLALMASSCLWAEITYELNDGDTGEAKYNDYGWKTKSDMFAAFMTDAGATGFETLESYQSSSTPLSSPGICAKLTDASPALKMAKWAWLKAYIEQAHTDQTAAGASALSADGSGAAWRYAVGAFFVEIQHTGWPKSADFTELGKDAAYIPAWGQNYPNPKHPTEEVTLVEPYRAGYLFGGWYASADFSGEKVTTVDQNTTGTLYAKWVSDGIFYELNGGVWNEYGWEDKGDMYDAFISEWKAYEGSDVTNRVTVPYEDQLGIGKSNGGIPTTIGTTALRDNLPAMFMHNDYSAKWGWLAKYMDIVAATQYKKMNAANGPKVQPTTNGAALTFSLGNFFGEDKNHTTDYIDAVDFTGEEAHLAAFQSTWGQTFPCVANPTEEITLNIPYKKGYQFGGWYKEADFSGTPITIVDQNFKGTLYAKWTQSGIVYELNGGVWNQYGWESKKDMYDAFLTDWIAYSGSTRATKTYEEQLGVGKSSAGIPGTIYGDELRAKLLTFFTDVNYQTKWGWLATYIDVVAAQQGKTQPTSNANTLTFSLGNFFGEDESNTTNYIGAVDFTGAEAHIAAFQTTWRQSFPGIEHPTESIVLHIAYKPRHTFEGWYDNAECTGAAITTVDQTYAGTLYAKWSIAPITYNLNGGQYNEYGWESKKDVYDDFIADWNTYSGTTRKTAQYEDQLGVGKSNVGIPTTITTVNSVNHRENLAAMFTNPTYSAKWGWLAIYLDAVAVQQEKTQPTSNANTLTFSLGNFFGEDNNHSTDYIGAVDFTGDERYLVSAQPYCSFTLPNPTYPTSEVTINNPTKEGYIFDGWYANADFSGAKVTKVNADTKGTLYAKWTENVIIIDENADNTTALTSFEGQTVTAKVTRAFSNDSYKTLTLPFDMDVAQIQDVFGDAKVYEFTSVVEGSDALHLQFEPTTSIVAGTPYIIDLPDGDYDAKDGFTIENVTIKTTLNSVKQDVITMEPVLDGGGRLDEAGQYWLSADNFLYNAGNYPTALLGLRAYFTSSSSMPIRARVVFDENQATSIPVVVAPENNVRKVMKNGQLIIIRGEQKYNVQGQRME